MPNNEAANGNYWLDQVDPELKRYFIVRNYPVINFSSRLKINFFHTLMQIPGPTAEGVSSTRIKGIGMKYFPSDIITTSNSTNSSREAVLYIHGGGRIMGSSSGAMESELCSKIVQLLKTPVFSVHYRLAPNHPFPAGLDDVV
jgi:acetyl esterase/lipase